jgi:hypothetical protein
LEEGLVPGIMETGNIVAATRNRRRDVKSAKAMAAELME